ncbi:MAG: protein kinase, partial [Acidobacteria bacterium]|nr:protein kinase [Acidobacteriota bacterium]
GFVKVIDFGLAKLNGVRNADFTPHSALRIPHSMISHSTEPGVVMGTVTYMSPEQLRGEGVDHRSDIFNLGLLLFEMLQGERPFQRATTAETMAAILNDEPPALSATIAPPLAKLVLRCLEKQPERRFHSAHDLGFALETLLATNASGAQRTESVALPQPNRWRKRSVAAVAGVTTLLALAFGLAYFPRPAQQAEPLRLAINPPEQATEFDWPAISPDGRTLAFIAEVGGKTQLWARTLSAPTARPLVEVRDNLPAPFWSPDSQFVAYFEQGKLKKIALTGGAPEILCDVPSQSSGAWSRDGVILFGNGPAGLSRVSANGGMATACTTVDTARADSGHYSPTFLPDGRHFLYWVSNPDAEKSGVYLASLEGGETRQLLSRLGATNVGVAVNPANQNQGYLAFVRQGALLTQGFDFSRNQLVGDPLRIADYVPAPIIFLAHFSLSANGVLVLQESEPDQQLTWFDRAGKKLGTLGPAGHYSSPRLSPDGQRLAVSRINSSAQSPPANLDDIHLFETASGASTPFTFDPAQDQGPLWSPDGSRLVWTSKREGAANLYRKAANGVGQDELLLRSAFYKSLCDWSTDGRFILYEELNPQSAHDLWVLPLTGEITGERGPWCWLNTSAAEFAARFSPDGRRIAYQSNESGRPEVYVQAFVPGAAAAGGKRQLSTNGGKAPRWRRDGRELYYAAADGKLMAVAITPGVDLHFGTPQPLFAPSGFQVNADWGYTLTGDGQRFLFVTNAETARVPPFTVLLNWMTQMKQ